jgi:dihydroflavonol-4-reductase
MTILVTGASGHVGVNLVKALLSRGRRVRALIHNSSYSLNEVDVETVRGDVSDLGSILRACENVSIVYHLAGRISIGQDSWSTLEKINVTGTHNVVEACLRSGINRLIYFSSIHALMQEPYHVPVDEYRPLVKSKHHPCYDRSKAAGVEEICQGIKQGLDTVILYPTAIIGPYDFGSSYFGDAILAMANGKLPALVDGGFDMVDVRDVAEGAVMAAEKAPPGSKYLLSGHWITIQEMAAMISNIIGVHYPRFVCPLLLASGISPVAENVARFMHRRPLFTRESMRALRCCNHYVSHEKATGELGYNPREFRKTLEDTLQWYNENGKLNGHRRLLENRSERTDIL